MVQMVAVQRRQWGGASRHRQRHQRTQAVAALLVLLVLAALLVLAQHGVPPLLQ
jgi:hypothetical protein